jgi:poly-gamma-glutamate synthesis protein (capsule biosynthesis protein)
MIEAGADVIYGHHSHTIHPVEIANGKPIVYSPGNFFFEFDRPRPYMERRSFILHLLFGPGLEVELVPLVHDEWGVPACAYGADATAVLERLATLSQSFGTSLRITGGRARLETRRAD